MLSNQITKKDTIVSNAYGSAFSILANEYIKQGENTHLIITEDSQQAYKVYKEIQYLTKNTNKEVLLFPDLEILAYDRFSSSINIVSNRLNILHTLSHKSKNIIVIVSISTVLKKLCPKSFITENSFILKTNDTFDITKQKNISNKLWICLCKQHL